MQADNQNTNHPNPPPPHPHHRHHIVYHQQIMEQSPAADSTTAIAGSWEHLSSAANANDELGLREESIVFIWQKLAQMPMAQGAFPLAPVYRERFLTKKCRISAFVQGNLDELEGKTIFLTVHDIGKSHLSFARFVANNQAMAPLREKAIFVHVCVPGQQPGAADMGEDFPTMDNLGEALAQLMGKLNLSKCVAVGEGAGADIVCRFAMNYHQMVLGIVLIHCTSTTHGILEQIKEIFMNLRLDDGLMGSASWNYLLTHRFGNHNLDQEQKQFLDRLRSERLNECNLSRYIYSFAHRDDFTSELGRSLAKVDAILVTGGRSGHNENVQHMFQHMNKSKTAMLVAQDCVDVLEQAPEYVVCALLLLCQRKGLLSDLQLPVLKTTADYSTPAAPDALTCSGAVASHEKPANTNQMFTA